MKNNARANRILHEYHGEYRKVGVQRKLDDVIRWMCDERSCSGCPIEKVCTERKQGHRLLEAWLKLEYLSNPLIKGQD